MAPKTLTIHDIAPATGRSRRRLPSRLRPSTVIRIDGVGFGEDPAACLVMFDDIEVTPFTTGFSDSSLIVTAPLPPRSTDTIRVRVDERVSEPIECRLVRPRPRRQPPGSEILRYYAQMDEVAAMSAQFGRWIANQTPFAAELRHVADSMDANRTALQRSGDVVRQLADAHGEVEVPEGLELVRGLERLDEALGDARAVEQLGELNTMMFGPDGYVATAIGDHDVGDVMFRRPGSDAPTEGGDTDIGLLGFIYEELAKAAESVEDLFDLAVPSISVTPVDVSLDLGGVISAFGKTFDAQGQFLSRSADIASAEALRRTLANQEAKLDRLAGDLADTIAAINANLETVGRRLADLDRRGVDLTESLSRARLDIVLNGGKLDLIEGKSDRTAGDVLRNGELLNLLEVKLDRLAPRVDLAVAGIGAANRGVDALEAKADVAAPKLDNLTTTAGRIETKIDIVDGKVDTVETKVDTVDGVVDRIDSNVDGIDNTVDQIANGVGVLDRKLDELEAKADRADVDPV